jgi:methionyl-tRNA formyltransferase
VSALRVAFAGTPEFAVPALRAIAGSSHTLVGVLTQPDRPKGRGRVLTPSPVKQAALELGVPVAQPETLRTEAGRAALEEWRPDVLVVVAYGQILPPEVLKLPRLGCVNIHASLLPRWRGAAPIQRAILAGDRETGVTIMQMDEGLDTGPILLQRSLPIEATSTAATLHDRLAALGAEALLEALEGLERGDLVPRPQPAEGVTYAAKLEKSEALIDWSRTADEIERQVRAFDPWPVAETRFEGEQLRIHAAHAVRGEEVAPDVAPGTIVAVKPDAILVRCGQGLLAVTRVQRPGRRPVAAHEFALGRRLEGLRLG